jgi:hypothetical protein
MTWTLQKLRAGKKKKGKYHSQGKAIKGKYNQMPEFDPSGGDITTTEWRYNCNIDTGGHTLHVVNFVLSFLVVTMVLCLFILS